MFCNKCGNEIKENEKFCNKCGEAVTAQNAAQPQTTEPKKSNIGLIIGIVLGLLLLLIIVIIAIIVVALLFFRNDKKQSTVTTTTGEVTTTTAASMDDDKKEGKVKELDFTNVSFKPEDNNEETKNIEFVSGFMGKEGYQGASRYAYIGVINKNKTNQDIWIYINYYKDGTRIGSDSAITSFVKPNVLTVIDVNLKPKDEYDKFDITVKTTPGDSYMVDVPVTDKNFKAINTDKKKADSYGTFTNDSKNKVYGYAACARYKDDKLVYLHRGYLGEVEVGKKKECTCYEVDLPEGLEYNKTECSLYNVYYTDGE
ncbi:MAG: zinc ribbon domain-containing protein [Bacilli bacterium]|nr:zinc ribbon domain-containing protein [Bacilli bacterium]